MGFCHRCGEISVGKCSKCGGRSVASTISSIISEGGADDGISSMIDKWKTQYADTILLPEGINLKKSPINTAKRIPVTQSTFYNPPKLSTTKVCTLCSKSLLSTSYIEQGLSYCKECYLELFNKGECPTCQKPVSERDSFIEYSTNTWHTDCFNCFNCKIPLESNPLIDLENRPCCEPCFMAQSGSARKKKVPSYSSSSNGSYSSQSSLSSLDSTNSSATSQLYMLQQQSNYTNSRRPRIDQDLFQPITDNKRAINIPQSPQISTSSPLMMMENLSISTPPSTTTSTSLSKRPCYYCYKPLGDSSQKKTKIPISDGNYAWFHKSCFLCSKCHLPFSKNGECLTDGTSFYHSRCDVSSKKMCFGCKKSIGTDSLQFNDNTYHFNCFKCYGNGCLISMGEPIFEVGKRPFCQSCFNLSSCGSFSPKQQTTSSLLSQAPQPQKRNHSYSSGKLGGSKRCPKCNTSISIMDEIPGPLASRWHKKCLVCVKCNKQLDSAAKMKSSLVYCTNCFP